MTSERARARLTAGLVLVAVVPLALASGFDLDPFDSAELALAAVTRGLGHPPGQPLYTLLGWALTRLPGRPLAWLASLSIVPAAVLFALASGRKGRAGTPPAMLGAAASVLLAVSLPGVREVCARVEVYALAAFFVGAAVAVRDDLAAGLLWGFAGAVNPVIAAQGALALGLARYKHAGRVAIGVAIGVLPLAYGWAVHGRDGEVMVWGAPHDLATFWRWITAADFQRNTSLSPERWLVHLAQLTWDQTRTGLVPLLVVGAVGLARAGERRTLGGAIFAACVGGAMIAANEPYVARNPDYVGYLLVPLALALAGVAEIFTFAMQRAVRTSAVAVVLVGALACAGAVRARTAGITRAMATEALATVPDHGILVLESDHLLFPALYLQQVERVRPDVLILNPGWASSAWAWRWSERRDPTIRPDLTPGLGGTVRLARALASRRAGRAVVGDHLGTLRHLVVGGVCPRGVGWSTDEGCGETRRERVRMRGQLVTWAVRARGPWEEAAVWTLAQELGDGANTLGCVDMAADFYRAGLGEPPVAAPLRRCDGRSVALPRHEGFLQISAWTIEARLARVSP